MQYSISKCNNQIEYNPHSTFLLSSPGPSFDSCRYLQQMKAASNEHSGISLSSKYKTKYLVIRYISTYHQESIDINSLYY